MKRKFSKILGVGLTLALLASLLLTAAPVSALTQPSVVLDTYVISQDAEYTISFRIDEELVGGLISVTGESVGTGVLVPVTGESVGTGDGATVTFAATLVSNPVVTGSVIVTDGVETFTVTSTTGTVDTLTGDQTGTGTLTLATGALSVTFNTAPAIAVDITAGYDYGEVTFTATLANTLVVPGSVSVTDGVETFTDDGEGTLTGDLGGTGTIVYSTRALSVTFNTAPAIAVDITADYDYALVPVTGESVGTGDAIEVTFTATLANTPVIAGSVSVTDTVETFTDDGEGTLTGALGGTGTIVYSTGALSVTFNTAPAIAVDITAGYFQGSGDSIVVTFPDDTVVASPTVEITAWHTTIAGVTLVETTLTDTAVAVDGLEVTITWKEDATITTLGSVQVKFTAGITNPDTTGAITLTVATSQEAAVESAPYTITPPDIDVPAGVVRVFNPAGIEFQSQTGDGAIVAAIGAAGDDWSIVIGEGRYTTAITTTGGWDGLTISGAAGADVLIEANMTVNSGVSATEATFTLENVTIDGTLTLGADADSAVIVGVTFLGGQNSLVIDADADTPDIIDCSFAPEDGDTAITLNSEADISGSSFTLVDGATAISVAAGADGGTIDDNTFTGGSGDGIILAGDTTVTDNVFDGLDWAIRVDGGTQVISGNTIQASDEIAIDVDGATDVQITANTITGNNTDVLLDVAADAGNVQVMFNDILDNAGDDGLLINNAAGGSLNVTNNWWGDPEGPGADAFSADVISAPFLAASVGDTGVLGTGIAAATLWDERTTVGVTVRAATGDMEIVGAAQYATNPGAAVDGTALGFWDVAVIDTDNNITEVTIRLYIAGVTADTEAYVWAADRGAWLEASDATPNLFGGFVTITVDDASVPTIEDLEELPFVLVEPPAATVLATTPVIVMPEAGAVDVVLRPTFDWLPVAGADGYYFQLADNPLFAPPLLISFEGDLSRLLAVQTAYTYATGLDDYSTAYHWRVKAVSGTEAAGDLLESAWVENVFITMDEPVEPADVILEPADVILEPADIIVTLPPATPITPSWIYVIIGVGAVLVIALLVLIVRTRRVA